MQVDELYQEAVDNDLIELEALIMFLVFEKGEQTKITMQSDAKELDMYFKDKHGKRMNFELKQYMEKMNMKRKPSLFEVICRDFALYVVELNGDRAFESVSRYNPIKVNALTSGEEMLLNGNPIKVETLIKDIKPPLIIGGNVERKNYLL